MQRLINSLYKFYTGNRFDIFSGTHLVPVPLNLVTSVMGGVNLATPPPPPPYNFLSDKRKNWLEMAARKAVKMLLY